jgi:D-xylono/L-arabinono-1,4-lactonase
MDMLTAEVVVDVPCGTGEGPLWHPDEKVLLWTDIPGGTLHRYDPASGKHDVLIESDRQIGGFTIQPDGSLLLFRDKGNVVAFRDGAVAETVIDHIPGEEELRFNDVIADPEGRVFAGTMKGGDTLGRLYRIERDGTYEAVVDGVGCSNGMAFTEDLRTMYYIDTVPNRIDAFDYDRETGAITNRRTVASLDKSRGEAGGPDGMTLDANDRLWVASFGGGGVFGFESDGTPRGKIIDVPTPRVTSLTFAGEDLRELYITSAGGGQRSDDDPHAGALFYARSPVPGRAEFRSRIGVAVSDRFQTG